jgi:hypothetical protein
MRQNQRKEKKMHKRLSKVGAEEVMGVVVLWASEVDFKD